MILQRLSYDVSHVKSMPVIAWILLAAFAPQKPSQQQSNQNASAYLDVFLNPGIFSSRMASIS